MVANSKIEFYYYIASYICCYRISGTFDDDFNLVVWWICLKSPTELKSPPILYLDGTVEVSYGNPWPIRQTKCSSICVCCLIAKLNVRQMYHLYGI